MFTKELETLINKHSLENESNTPDWILAQYIRNCLNAWNTATQARDKWYGHKTLSNTITNELEMN
jgi:hypothetical protein